MSPAEAGFPGQRDFRPLRSLGRSIRSRPALSPVHSLSYKGYRCRNSIACEQVWGPTCFPSCLSIHLGDVVFPSFTTQRTGTVIVRNHRLR
jgi:hypothetical protein